MVSTIPAIDVVVTRHQGLVEFLVQEGVLTPDILVISHASPEAIQDKHVLGILPLSLAAEAASVTTADMKLPAEMRR